MANSTLLDKANEATLTEASEILGIKRYRIQNAIDAKIIPAKKRKRVGSDGTPRRVWIVDLSDIEAWIDITQTSRTEQALKYLELGYHPETIATEMEIEYESVLKLLNRAGVKFKPSGKGRGTVESINGKDKF